MKLRRGAARRFLAEPYARGVKGALTASRRAAGSIRVQAAILGRLQADHRQGGGSPTPPSNASSTIAPRPRPPGVTSVTLQRLGMPGLPSTSMTARRGGGTTAREGAAEAAKEVAGRSRHPAARAEDERSGRARSAAWRERRIGRPRLHARAPDDARRSTSPNGRKPAGNRSCPRDEPSEIAGSVSCWRQARPARRSRSAPDERSHASGRRAGSENADLSENT